jgi:DNA-binding NarL/FixJ family response regulator
VRSIARSTTDALKGSCILVVEDDFLVLSELEALLCDAGADYVISCRTVEEAVAMLDGCVPAVAILDVRVGRDSIAPVTRRLARQGIPFLFYTGQTGEDQMLAEWRGRPLLSKPAPAHRIVSAVTDLMVQNQALSRRSA